MNITPTIDEIIGIRAEMQHVSLIKCEDNDPD